MPLLGLLSLVVASPSPASGDDGSWTVVMEGKQTKAR
jgi:hypothetical protein